MNANDLFNEACRDLPEGWRIEIALEAGSGNCTLYDPFDDKLYVCCDDLTLAEHLVLCIDRAKLEAVNYK